MNALRNKEDSVIGQGMRIQRNQFLKASALAESRRPTETKEKWRLPMASELGKLLDVERNSITKGKFTIEEGYRKL
jgi:hypothetical protein